MGVMIAQHVAAKRPHLVKRLILCVTAHRLAAAGHAQGEKLMALARAGRWLAFMRLSNELCFSGLMRRLVALALWLAMPLSWLMRRREQRPALVRAALDFCISANACAAHDAEQLLASIRVPTLVWGASADCLFPAAALAEMAGLLPEARLVTVSGAHAAFLQKRSRFQRSVVDFLGLPVGGAEP
jgi:pimeloyl-ACP methyl ester carboxylesterase